MTSSVSQTVRTFGDEWAKYHQARHPVGWMMRTDQEIPWVRFHALPESKRYADDEAERTVILKRANDLGSLLFGAGALCWMIETRADGVIGDGEFAGEFVEDNDPDSPVWRVYVQSIAWEAGAFDTKIASIANDGPYYVTWMDRASGASLAPYDGGFDLFPASHEQAETLRLERSRWLSPRADGL